MVISLKRPTLQRVRSRLRRGRDLFLGAGELLRRATHEVWDAVTIAAVPSTDTPRRRRLIARLSRILQRSGGHDCVVSAAALDIGTGEVVSLQGMWPVPMASTAKIPIALRLLDLVESGELTLDLPVPIRRRYLCVGGPLEKAFRDTCGLPQDVVTVIPLSELIRSMLADSDNSATDVLLELAGGPAAVTSHLRALGITDMAVDRSIRQIFTDVVRSAGAPSSAIPEAEPLTRWLWHSALSQLPSGLEPGWKGYLSDPRDQTTAEAMVHLLGAIQSGRAVNGAARAFLLEAMAAAASLRRRLGARLPAHVKISSKSGSMGWALAADVGLIELPGGNRHLAVAVFVTGMDRRIALRIIAEITRAFYDHFAPQASG